ncbi:multicopper oxidase-domain-containing protein [Podospora didyma]|uniref:Multicopper oxidase-domain-containing protein n=1 Tax=Podospora didyma TaxID=330526 RepID=A0AAE0U8V1_9PEZI|nr:multicopper oxidase-domain-containing protein [Podospora didyma]
MKLYERFWSSLTQLLNIATLSPFGDYNDNGRQQVPIINTEIAVGNPTYPIPEPPKGPSFIPPGHDIGNKFRCEYPSMIGWEPCSTEENRGCWLRNPTTGEEFNINTDYEFLAPQGIQRSYVLEISNTSYNADGLDFTEAKLFNLLGEKPQYPGPWLQACWGDVLQVTVINKMQYNGTSIHWHGIRQNQTMHMDGVNGITQCPIAPNDSFVYKFNITQYGSSWYHSHYSLQYADGAVGPMTLHGPASGNFTEAADIPLLMTDWGHRSAFEALYTNDLGNATVLLNGVGNVTRFLNISADLEIPEQYSLHFKNRTSAAGPKKYLLRLINTSFDTTFVFSIDNHNLTVIGADFVPIHPYSNTSVLIGIGQRYNVIVEANPIHNESQPIYGDGNFWIRNYVVNCGGGDVSRPQGYEQAGILRYNASSTDLPKSLPWNKMSKACSDETYSSLKPILPWTIGNPSNAGQEHDVVSNFVNPDPKLGPAAKFSMEPTTFGSTFLPLRIDFDNPTFLHLNNTGDWPERWIIVPENYTDKDWIYLVIAGDRKNQYRAGAHPIHLHGHDFAILQQTENQNLSYGNLNLKFDNPPRRDVVLLPRNGFIVIAFKTDNPGSWLMHCHIAKHAAWGLAMQVLERQKKADEIWPWETSEAIAVARETCRKWNEWHGDCKKWWKPDIGPDGCERNRTDPVYAFQDDSGI